MSGHMRWSGNGNSMVHPDKSMLLAYTRRQSLGEAESYIRQHIKVCEECALCCDEYEQVSAGLQDTLEYWKRTSIYPPLAERVLEDIEDPPAAQLARRERQVERQYRNTASTTKRQSLNWTRLLSTSVAVLVVIAVFASLLVYTLPHLPNSNKQGGHPSIPVPSHTSTATPTRSLTPPATATIGVTRGITVTPGTQKLTLSICAVSTSSFTLCGSALKPGDVFEVTANVRGKGVLLQHTAVVSKDGKLTVRWHLNSCSLNRINVHLHSRKTSLDIAQSVPVSNRNCHGQGIESDDAIG